MPIKKPPKESAEEDSCYRWRPKGIEDLSAETFTKKKPAEDRGRSDEEEAEEAQEAPAAAGGPLQDMSEEDMSAETFVDQQRPRPPTKKRQK